MNKTRDVRQLLRKVLKLCIFDVLSVWHLPESHSASFHLCTILPHAKRIYWSIVLSTLWRNSHSYRRSMLKIIKTVYLTLWQIFEYTHKLCQKYILVVLRFSQFYDFFEKKKKIKPIQSIVFLLIFKMLNENGKGDSFIVIIKFWWTFLIRNFDMIYFVQRKETSDTKK